MYRFKCITFHLLVNLFSFKKYFFLNYKVKLKISYKTGLGKRLIIFTKMCCLLKSVTFYFALGMIFATPGAWCACLRFATTSSPKIVGTTSGFWRVIGTLPPNKCGHTCRLYENDNLYFVISYKRGHALNSA